MNIINIQQEEDPIKQVYMIENLVPIKVKFQYQNFRCNENAIWDIEKTPLETFITCQQIIKDALLEANKLQIQEQQFNEIVVDVNESVQQQIKYNSNLLKLKNILVNWQFSSNYSKEMDQFINIKISLQIDEGKHFVDQFQWDVASNINEVIPFAENLVKDCNINASYTGEIVNQIFDNIFRCLQTRFERLIKFCNVQYLQYQMIENQNSQIQLSKQNIIYGANETLPQLPLDYADFKLGDPNFLDYNEILQFISKNKNFLSKKNEKLIDDHISNYQLLQYQDQQRQIAEQFGFTQFNTQSQNYLNLYKNFPMAKQQFQPQNTFQNQAIIDNIQSMMQKNSLIKNQNNIQQLAQNSMFKFPNNLITYGINT